MILTPTKQYPHYFKATADRISVDNKQTNNPGRFGPTSYEFKHMLFEEEILVKATQLRLLSMNKSFVSEVTPQPFDIDMVVNRLLFEE